MSGSCSSSVVMTLSFLTACTLPEASNALPAGWPAVAHEAANRRSNTELRFMAYMTDLLVRDLQRMSANAPRLLGDLHPSRIAPKQQHRAEAEYRGPAYHAG